MSQETIPAFHPKDELRKIYSAKLGPIYGDESIPFEQVEEVMSALVNKKDELLKKYGADAYRYTLYHALGGSGIMADTDIIADDFPGTDSVADFIDELSARYQKPEDLQNPENQVI